MLGVNYTFIHCGFSRCKYNKNARCNPPENKDGDNVLVIKPIRGFAGKYYPGCSLYTEKTPEPRTIRSKRVTKRC